jgi:hypothetical protein
MRQNTLQEQYNLIKEGKGNKDVFLKTVKSSHPHLIRNAADFKEATTILKQKSIISENFVGFEPINNPTAREKEGYEVKFSKFLEEAKAVEKKTTKEVTDLEEKNFDYKDKKNIDNVYGEEFLKGYYTEMKDPKNHKKTVDELKEMVAKNLAKDQLYYVKDGQFGVKGIGYTDELPGLKASKTDQMEKVKMNENQNKMIKLSELLEEGYGAREYEMGKKAGEKAEKKKLKKESIQDRIKEIEKKGSIAALEAKMNALDEEVSSRNGKLTMVSENEDLAEFVNPARVTEMKKEIKELEKAKAKYGKMYEKMTGTAYSKPIVSEEE